MNVWDESPLPPPDAGAQSSDVPTSSGGDSGGPPAPPNAGGDHESEPDEERALFRRILGIPAWMLLLLAIVIWVGVVAALILPDDGPANDAASGRPTATGAAVPTAPPSPTAPEVVITSPPDTSLPATSIPVTTAAAASTVPAAPPTAPPTTPSTPASTAPTAPATTTPATTTTTPTTTTPTTTTPTTTTTTTPTTTNPATTTVPAGAPTVTISEPTTVMGDAGRSLTVTPRRDACRYGPECLVVAFAIDGFPTQPEEFVCEFSSGARFVFRFSLPAVDPACSTIDLPDTIVVEVGGLRSEPVTIER